MYQIIDEATFARAQDSPISEPVKALLRQRRIQLLGVNPQLKLGDVAHFIAVDHGDTIATIEAAAGYPVVTTHAFEWVSDHRGLLEAVTILNDDGFALVLICPDDEAIDAELLALLRKLAEPEARIAVGQTHQGRTTAA